MFRFAKWKIFSIIGMTLVAMLTAAPGARAVEGACAQIVLEVDQADVAKRYLANLRDEVRRIMREESIRLTGGIGAEGRAVQVRVPDASDRARALPKMHMLTRSELVRGGEPGALLVDISEDADGLIRLSLTEAGILQKVRQSRELTIEVLRRRVESFSNNRELVVQRQGDDRVLLQGPIDFKYLMQLMDSRAKLALRLVAEPGDKPEEVEKLYEYDRSGTVRAAHLIEKKVSAHGEDITDAQVGFDKNTGEPIINFRLNGRGAQRLAEVTSSNVGRLLAIVLDIRVMSAHRILGPVTEGYGRLSGNFTIEHASALAMYLRVGNFPATTRIVDERGTCQDIDNAWIGPDKPG